MSKNRYFVRCVLLVAAMAVLPPAVGRAVPTDKELKLIGVLQSDAPAQEKAITCKQLAVYGTQEAVPALAALLADPHLASWARIALEAIPGPAADAALRDAMGKVQGRLLVGVINSIGVRCDAQAVDGLAAKLEDADVVVSGGRGGLGLHWRRSGCERPGAGDRQCLLGGSPRVAEGCIRCAEKYLAQGQSAQAKKLYDAVCTADVPKQRILDATRGAILARGSAGVSFLVEQLTSSDKGRLGIGLWTARELPGQDVTEALAAAMSRLSPDRQPLLLLAIADRKDAAVLPAVLKAAQSGSIEVRTTAAGALLNVGDVSCVPVLLDAAVQDDAPLAQTAKMTLAKLPGKEVESDLLTRLAQATGKTRKVLIELAGYRQLDAALPAIVQSIEDSDAAVRAAAIQAVGALGGAAQVADLVKLAQKIQNRGDIEKALQAVCSRSGSACAPSLLPLVQSEDASLRMVGVHAMAVAGGPAALAAVKSAITDKDESVQDEAVRTLSTWPNNWPQDAAAADVLLGLAKSGKKTLHQVLGLRGYLQYLRGDKSLAPGDKLAKVNDLQNLIQRPEEKRLAVAAVSGVEAPGALEMLTKFAADPAVMEEACSAIVNLAGKNIPGVSAEQRRSALQAVVEKSKNAGTKRKAEQLLGGI